VTRWSHIALVLLLAFPLLGVGSKKVCDGTWSPTFFGTTTVDHLLIGGSLGLGTYEFFTVNDTTPSVLGSALWKTAIGHGAVNSITNFDDGIQGQWISILDQSTADITFICGGTLSCGSENLITEIGDTTTWLFNGFTWDLKHVQDISIDNNPSSFLPLAGGTMTGDLIFNDDVNATFGTGSDATISYDDTNLLIDPQVVGSGYTDFTGAIFVAEDEDGSAYSRFGGAPIETNPSATIDMLVSRKVQTGDTGSRRAGLFVTDVATDDNSTTSQSFGVNAFVYTAEANDGDLTRTNNRVGSAAGVRAGLRHRGDGLISLGGAFAGRVEIQGGTEDGVITTAYAFLDEGCDGGNGALGGITNCSGLLVKNSSGGATTVGTQYGVQIEDLSHAVNSYGIRVGATNSGAIWLSGTGGTAVEGIQFGSPDTNLYRSAASTLKTDDNFIALSLSTGEFEVEDDGDTFWVGDGTGVPYGAMYQTGGSTFTTTLTDQSTWYELDAATTNMNADELNMVTFPDDHYMEVAKAGRYTILYTASIEINSVAGGAQHIELGIMINGTEVVPGPGVSHWSFAAISTESAYSGIALLDLNADDEISIGAVNDSSAGKILTVDHLNVITTMEGGT